jgi:ADP-ribose pyrophosphatase
MDRLTTFWTTPGFTDERIHIYLATGLTRGETRHEADEFIELATFSLSEALRMIERGDITDGKTIIGLLFAAGYRAG